MSSSMLLGLIADPNLTAEQSAEVRDNISILNSFIHTLCEAIPDCGLADGHSHNLSYTASLVTQLIDTLETASSNALPK